MKKQIMFIILLITVMSCGFFDSEEWAETRKEMEEKGFKCVEAYDDGYTRTPGKCGYY